MIGKKRRRKPGPASERSKCKLPRYAGRKTQIQKVKNEGRSDESVKQLKYGFKLLWEEVPATMRRYKVGKPGSFDPRNGFGGKCWGWPSECNLTENSAEGIFWDVFRKKSLTKHQMEVVSKALAFAHELQGGEPLSNWKTVKRLKPVVKTATMAPPKGSVIPTKIPSVTEIETGFTREWSPECGQGIPEWSLGLVCAHDAFPCGLRSQEDVDRIKKSREHRFDWKNGWHATAFQGGRAKLCGAKKGTRPWWLYTSCFCKGEEHVRPPALCENAMLDDQGYPFEPDTVTWTTTCPLACLEILGMYQKGEGFRRYPKWNGKRFLPSHNVADPVKFGIDWLVLQGACEGERFDHNAGRKCFARLSRACHLEYADVFQVVGDLQEVWRESYDPDLPPSQFSAREQSKDPSVCCAALRVIARRILKRGKAFPPRLTRQERLLYVHLVHSAGKEAADRALFGDDDLFGS